MSGVFDAEVYRNSTGDSDLGESAEKEWRGLRGVERSHERGLA